MGILDSLKLMKANLEGNQVGGFDKAFRRQMEKVARDRAAKIKRDDGSPSRLTPALLSANPPDKEFRWVITKAGGELRMSTWARNATKDVFTVQDSDGEQIMNRLNLFRKDPELK